MPSKITFILQHAMMLLQLYMVFTVGIFVHALSFIVTVVQL